MAQGIPCGHNRVARLIRTCGSAGVWPNGLIATQEQAFKVKTTDSNHDHPVAPNLLTQQFVAAQPNQIRLADTLAPVRSAGVAYIRIAEGWLYLAVVMDIYSRRIVWAMSDSLERQLVLNALQMACLTRRPPPGLIHH